MEDEKKNEKYILQVSRKRIHFLFSVIIIFGIILTVYILNNKELKEIDYSSFETPKEGIVEEDVPYGIHITVIPSEYSPDVYGNNGIGEWHLRIIFHKPQGLTKENIKFAKEYLAKFNDEGSEQISEVLMKFKKIDRNEMESINIMNVGLDLYNSKEFVELYLSWSYLE
ncbi:hypothetical protein EDD66_106207 [Mobilisporobacter senegalensis]|uniref:Uncharacterized protein n=1 Tax=Mobilisporobacter senegalensis TaxID=1329262 RepID=A0A3N1XLD3_9FIRM|nr:hypothetical protein [Mobilisporobacter senegalensis]ROR27509.1 hypothetical protein EDD66_106207 [Mobilisporobacter senegalensis]